MMRDWHRRKARRLAAVAQKKREKLRQIDEQMERHEHRAQHWDFIARRNRSTIKERKRQ
jgi:hypothetical protein